MTDDKCPSCGNVVDFDPVLDSFAVCDSCMAELIIVTETWLEEATERE